MRTWNFKPLAFLPLAALLAALSLPARADATDAADAPPSVSAETAVLMDRDSGRVVFAKDPDKPMQIASTTKILTALVALERCGLEETVSIRRDWTETEGSSMYLRPGESYTVRELLYGLLLVSGNDAAVALACHTAGSVEAFAALMNEKALALGMRDSHFVNPHGLGAEGHYATARDMGVLACAAMRDPTFAEIAATKTATVAGTQLRNHNKLLWQYEGAVGVKTGYTKAAGRALVSCAEREGCALVCVTLNDPDDWADHAALLDWGFTRFRSVCTDALFWDVPVVSGLSEQVRVVPKEAVRLFLEAESAPRAAVEAPKFVYAPVAAGDTAGFLRYYDPDGGILASVELVFADSVPLDGAVPLRFWEKLRWAWYFACRNSRYMGEPSYALF